MVKFTLHWIGGNTEEVEGTDIADACRRAGIGGNKLADLVFFEEAGGRRVQVAGRIPCGCVYHAEEGSSCSHDLELVGLAGL